MLNLSEVLRLIVLKIFFNNSRNAVGLLVS